MAFWVATGVVVFWFPPDWRTELFANGLGMGGLVFVASWVWGTKKYGVIAAIGLWSLIVMGRFGVLDWITFGAWMVIVGLITLVN
ncbi:hypothetical protein HYS82_02505 [Candidatus Amesbacteria bacterium]|nr:hypothetical protein [Candidatus Amesbacteria bacterium]